MSSSFQCTGRQIYFSVNPPACDDVFLMVGPCCSWGVHRRQIHFSVNPPACDDVFLMVGPCCSWGCTGRQVYHSTTTQYSEPEPQMRIAIYFIAPDLLLLRQKNVIKVVLRKYRKTTLGPQSSSFWSYFNFGPTFNEGPVFIPERLQHA